MADPKTRSVVVYTLNAKTGEYDELARFGPDIVRSAVLEGFEAPVAPSSRRPCSRRPAANAAGPRLPATSWKQARRLTSSGLQY